MPQQADAWKAEHAAVVYAPLMVKEAATAAAIPSVHILLGTAALSLHANGVKDLRKKLLVYPVRYLCCNSSLARCGTNEGCRKARGAWAQVPDINDVQ